MRLRIGDEAVHAIRSIPDSPHGTLLLGANGDSGHKAAGQRHARSDIYRVAYAAGDSAGQIGYPEESKAIERAMSPAARDSAAGFQILSVGLAMAVAYLSYRRFWPRRQWRRRKPRP